MKIIIVLYKIVYKITSNSISYNTKILLLGGVIMTVTGQLFFIEYFSFHFHDYLNTFT